MRTTALAAGLTTTMAGCVFMCTDVGCMGSVTITIYEVWLEDGEYQAEADLSLGTEAVSFEIVEGKALMEDGDSRTVRYDGTDLVFSFIAGDPPETFQVRLLDVDDAVIVEGEVSPELDGEYYPNGKRCGVGCSSWKAEL